MVPAQQRILCVDNNASSNLTVYLLERVGYELKTASSLADAGKLAQVERFDLQLINHRLVDGLEIDSCEKLDKFARAVQSSSISPWHTHTNKYSRFIAGNIIILWLRYMFMTSWATPHGC